jgi:hypothetical protein
MFSNKFDVEIVYVYNFWIISITFKILLIRSFFFSFKFVILSFWHVLLSIKFFLDFELLFPCFSQQKLPT